MPLNNFETNRAETVRKISVESYSQSNPQEKSKFLNKIIALTETGKLLPDYATKALYNILKGKNFTGKNNFRARYQDYENNFRPKLESKELLQNAPYYRSDRIKSTDKPYNKWLYDSFQGYKTQNTALIHFLANKEKSKLSLSPPEKIKKESVAKRGKLKREIRFRNFTRLDSKAFKKELRAQKLRKRVFKDAENGDYTFRPEVETHLHKTTTLGNLFPNLNQISVLIGHKRSTRSRRNRKIGETIVFIRRGNRFFPKNKRKYGTPSGEIWNGDKVFFTVKNYREEGTDNFLSDKPLPTEKIQPDIDSKTKDPVLEKKKKQIRQRLNSEINQLDTANIQRNIPQLNTSPKITTHPHTLIPESISRSGYEFDLGANNCAQFAFRLLGKIHGRELTKRGVFADAWTMLHSMSSKEREDGVDPGTYVKIAGNISLDHDYYYNRKRNLSYVRAKLLYNPKYINDLAKLFIEGKKIADKKGVAFITYYYHESANTNKALRKTAELLRNGVDIRETSPTTHIELMTGNLEVNFLKEEIRKKIKKSGPKRGKYLDLLLDTYIDVQVKTDNFPYSKTQKSYREKALTRLSILAKTGTKIFLTDAHGKKREIKLVETNDGYRLMETKTNQEVYFDKANPETFSFLDLASKTGGRTQNILKHYLLFKANHKNTDVSDFNNWFVLPGKILELPGLKWPQIKDFKQQKINSNIKKYSSINTSFERGRSINNIQQLYKKYKISKKDLVYYNEGLRRAGVDPNKIGKDAPIPIFNMDKLKSLFIVEALAKRNKDIREKYLSQLSELNKKIAASTNKREKDQLLSEKNQLIDKIVIPHITLLNIAAEGHATREMFSQKGLAYLDSQISKLTGLIEHTEAQITSLRAKRQPYFKIRTAIRFKHSLTRRKLKLQMERNKLKKILDENIVISVVPGAGKIYLLGEFTKHSPYLKSLRLLPEEKSFILSYIDKINQNIDLSIIQKGKYQAYKDWEAGTVVFVNKASLTRLEKIIRTYREIRKNNSRTPKTLSCGKDNKQQIIEKKIPVEVRDAIESVAENDPILTKLMLYTWAQEQGRGTRRKHLKSAANLIGVGNSYGMFQVRPTIFSRLIKGSEFGLSEKRRILKDEYKKKFGVNSYETFVEKIKTNTLFNAKVAAYLLKSNIIFVQEQLKKLGVTDLAKDSALMHTMILASYNRGPNTTSRAIINFRIEKLREIFPLVAQNYNALNQTNDFSEFIKKHGRKISRFELAAMKVSKGSWSGFWKTDSDLARVSDGFLKVRIATQPVEDAYKIFIFAKKLKQSFPNFTKLSDNEIELQAISFIKKPADFIKTQLYKDFVKFAQKNNKKTFNMNNTALSFNDLYKKGIGRELSYGFVVTRDGQHEKLSRSIFDNSDALKLNQKKVHLAAK